MAWEVYTIGGGEILYDVFNAVASLTRSGNYLKFISMISTIGLFWALLMTAFGNSFKGFITWFASFFLIYNVMFLPKVTVVINDPINFGKPYQSVDNIPIALGIAASISSQAGKALTEATEAVFSTPDDLKYHRTGMLFGSRMFMMASSLKITDANFSASINSFVKQCVFYDILHHRLTLEELINSNDIWSLMKSNPSRARSFELSGAGGRQILTCAAGVTELEKYWQPEVKKATNLFETAFTSSGSANSQKANIALRNLTLSGIPSSYQTFFGISKDATEVIKQNMLINAIDSAGADFSGIGSKTNIYTDIRASVQTKAAFKASARQAEEYLPYLKTVLEIMFYGLFPFIFVIFLLPIGPTALKGYFASFLWIQTWAPMFAILNRIMTGFAASKSYGIAGAVGVTIATQGGIVNVNEGIADMAGYLAWSIPFLSAGLAAGMISSVSSLSTSILAVPQSATNSAANEVATGNINLGNSSIGNGSYGNLSANKINDAMSFDGGRMQIVNSMGGTTSMNAFGEYTSNQAGAVSSIPNLNMRMSEGYTSQLMSSASENEAAGLSASENASLSKAHAIDKATQNMVTHTFNENSTNDYQKGWSTQERDSYNKVESAIDDFSKTHNINKQLTAQLLAGASANINPERLRSGKGGRGVGLKIGADYFGTKSLGDLYSDAQKYSEHKSLSQDLGIVQEAVARHGFSETDSRSKALQGTVSDSLRQANNYEEQSRAYFDKSDSLRKEAQYTASNSFAVDRDMINAMIHWASNQKDIYGHELGHEKVVRVLTGSSASDKATSDRLINEYITYTDAKSAIGKHYLNSKTTVGVGDLNEGYNSFKSTLDKDVGYISNDNNGSFGFDNYELKMETLQAKGRVQATINSEVIDKKVRHEVSNERSGDMVDVFHYTEAGNPKK